MTDKKLKIEEDQNKILAPVLHYKRMLEEIFQDSSADLKLKRQIPLSFSAANESNVIHGGVTGWISFDFAVLEVLWVEKNYQGKGLGKELLIKLEEAAIINRCTHMLTSTNSLSQSLGFWLKNGFELLHTVEGDVSIYYLQKKLHS